MLHSVPLGDGQGRVRGDVDHVLIGPPGVVTINRLYRIPTGAAGLLRAAVLARRDQPPAAPQPDVVSLLGRDGWLLPGARPDAPLSVRALQQRLAIGADRAGLAVVADPFRHVEVHDLRGAHRLP